MNSQEHKFKEVLEGEFITLSKVAITDALFIYNLRSSESAKYLNKPDNYSVESQVGWIESRTDAEINYIIHRKMDSFKVGMCAIYECDWVNGVSNMGRLLLSDEYVHNGTPYGLEALKLCYDYIFNVMNFRKITGTINLRNQKVYDLQKYLGMDEEGLLIDHVLLDGKPQSIHVLSLFKEDFPEYKAKIDKLLDKFRK